ncbi:hypothetical protein PFAG_02199 [Plasmodium falciparum Santa Lucia]|uniref:Uncharacterized protein n=1 Tax=Plasmodium falciparum Santa Lucia TaxID=478859 RepID=W7FK75_PLAFA|nr:hypothetical protein PFAG_02199 [Plasmodium falciparum Santa Lucia]
MNLPGKYKFKIEDYEEEEDEDEDEEHLKRRLPLNMLLDTYNIVMHRTAYMECVSKYKKFIKKIVLLNRITQYMILKKNRML